MGLVALHSRRRSIDFPTVLCTEEAGARCVDGVGVGWIDGEGAGFMDGARARCADGVGVGCTDEEGAGFMDKAATRADRAAARCIDRKLACCSDGVISAKTSSSS